MLINNVNPENEPPNPFGDWKLVKSRRPRHMNFDPEHRERPSTVSPTTRSFDHPKHPHAHPPTRGPRAREPTSYLPLSRDMTARPTTKHASCYEHLKPTEKDNTPIVQYPSPSQFLGAIPSSTLNQISKENNFNLVNARKLKNPKHSSEPRESYPSLASSKSLIAPIPLSYKN